MLKFKKSKCQHCNNETLMEVRDTIKKESGNILNDDYYYDVNVVVLCPICNNYNIINAYWDKSFGKNENLDQYDIYDGDLVMEEHIFPIDSDLLTRKYNLIPNDVIENFRKAINLKYQDEESCLIKLRKTLEMICNDKSAIGSDLFSKIMDLSGKGILPKTLNLASTITRKLGNIGAHETNIDINKNELECAIELVEYIIQYIYVLPKEIENLNKKFNLVESK